MNDSVFTYGFPDGVPEDVLKVIKYQSIIRKGEKKKVPIETFGCTGDPGSRTNAVRYVWSLALADIPCRLVY